MTVRLVSTLLGLSLIVGLLTGCGAGGGDGPGPPTVRVFVVGMPNDPAALVVEDVLGAQGVEVEPAASDAEADVLVTSTDPQDPDAVPFVTRYWVAAVALSHPASALTMDALGDAVTGRVSDWSALTGSSAPLRVLTPVEPAPPVEQWWPGTASAAEPVPLEGIAETLADDAGALALVPLEAADARVRSLDIDGANVVFGRGDVASYPLVERAWVATPPRTDGRGDELDALLRAAARSVADRLSVAAPEPVVLRATGDIIPSRCVYAKQRDYGDFRHAFLELGPWLAEADLTVGSLDASISDAGEPYGCVETFSLLAPAASVEGLTYAGFDVMSVATNHVKDCGQSACGDQAFFDTLSNLRANDIEPVGGGADLAEAREPAVLTVRDTRFAFLAYDQVAPYYHAGPEAAGTAPLTGASLREDVASARAMADVVVVLPQWGVEYTAEPTAGQRALAAAAVGAGADLVIGNHPHWVQASEVIDGAFVAYALGNFVFDQDWSIETQQGAVLEAVFHGSELKGIEYHAVRIVDQHQPVFASPEEAREILDRIWSASAALR